MNGAQLTAALLFGAIGAQGVVVRGADGPPVGSVRRRAQIRSRNSPGPHGEPRPVSAETPHAFAEKDFNACRDPAARKQPVKLTLKPDTSVDDLVVWISSITCREFVWSEAIAAHNKKVTIVAPLPMRPKEAFGLFLDALDSIGLTVEPSGKFWRIIETHKVRSTPVPLYGFDGRRLSG